jgi:hydroxylamine reductase (hybrid-cluster protein)
MPYGTPKQMANIEGHKFKEGQSGNLAGRPRNRVKKLLREILPKTKLKKTTELTIEEIDTIERIVLAMQLSDLQLFAKADDTPSYMKTLCMAIIIDMKNGKTSTVEKLRDRQYGIPKQQVDITSGGSPLTSPQSMTQEQARKLLDEIEEKY